MNARLISLRPAFATSGVSGLAYRENSRVPTQRKVEWPGVPLLVPLWVATGIVGAAAALLFYGPVAWALPALAFLVACPLLVAWVLLVEGGDAPETSSKR